MQSTDNNMQLQCIQTMWQVNSVLGGVTL